MAGLKSRILSEEKNHPKHKYSVTFVTKVGTNFFYYINFSMLLLLLDLKSQSEHSGLRLDTSSHNILIFRFLRSIISEKKIKTSANL